MDDQAIIALFFARSEQAITELSNKYGPVCRKIADQILNNRQDAEECVNDAFLAVWNTVPPQNPDPLRSYLCRIVRNQAIKKYHANTAEKRNSFYDAALEELEEILPAASAVEDQFGAMELARGINAFLATLDKDSRVLFVRRYWYAASIESLAEHFQTSKHNISVRLSRIRNRLKTYLHREGMI